MSAKVQTSYDETTVRKPRIKVTFKEDYGPTSQITWNNEDVLKGLRTMFGVRPHEDVASIELSEEGITAHFYTKDQG